MYGLFLLLLPSSNWHGANEALPNCYCGALCCFLHFFLFLLRAPEREGTDVDDNERESVIEP